MKEIMSMFQGKSLLITGGTGSFGHAVMQCFLHADIREIRIFSRDEKKQDEMRRALNDNRVKFYIGDVREYAGIAHALAGVDYVFHAAALKQVPSCEFFPMEAVMTNILGTENVIRAAVAQKVKKVVCLSTDKAVYPINAMGISKAMMEKVLIAHSRNLTTSDTIVCGTRYGNVMASRGSVIPLFVEQIKTGMPLTVTDPQMTRYLMSLEEAVDLVLFAFQHASQGDIFVQKAPAASTGDVALAVKSLFQADNPIRIIGTRHGEKLYETLLTREEMSVADDLGKYYRIPADVRDLNYDKYFVEGREGLAESHEYTSHNTQRLSVEEVKERLMPLALIRDALNFQGSKPQ